MKKKNVLAIRVDGNRHIGLGHIFRCFHLATSLKRKTGICSEFFILKSSCIPYILKLMEKERFTFHTVSTSSNPWKEDIGLSLNLLNEGYGAILVDLLISDSSDEDLNENEEYIVTDVEQYLEEISKLGLPLFAFSDQFDRMTMKADVIINTCPVQKYEWYKDVKDSKYLLGPKYYILADSFKRLKDKRKQFRRTNPKVVVFCGGNDHRGFTMLIVRTLKTLSLQVEIEVIIGAATSNSTEIIKVLEKEGIKTYFQISDIAKILFDGDLLVTTSGNTLFDIAALGLPAIAFSTRERQSVTAHYFSTRGSCMNLGNVDANVWKRLKNYAENMISNEERLEEMSSKGRHLVDGSGVNRITEEIESWMQ